MRYFIALEIPVEDRKELLQVQELLKELLPKVRLTNNDKLHITLAFIGEQPDELKETLINILNDSVTGVSPFNIIPSYIDGFPNIHHPHTIWVGPKGDIEKLLLIRERIKDSLNGIQIGIDERRFTPHIAIAKTNGNLFIDLQTEDKLRNIMDRSFAPIKVSSIKLFESVPDEGFHKHNTLAEIKLG